MTPRGGLSENGKVLVFALLFPIFWPFIPVLLICMGCEAARDAFWRWRQRRRTAHDAQLETRDKNL